MYVSMYVVYQTCLEVDPHLELGHRHARKPEERGVELCHLLRGSALTAHVVEAREERLYVGVRIGVYWDVGGRMAVLEKTSISELRACVNDGVDVVDVDTTRCMRKLSYSYPICMQRSHTSIVEPETTAAVDSSRANRAAHVHRAAICYWLL